MLEHAYGTGATKRATRCRALLLLVLASAPVLAMAGDTLLSRDLHCDRFELARSREICRALEREMEWTWMGHAVIWPGFRVTWSALRRVFCAMHVEPRDTQALVALVTWHRKGEQNDMRLENGATSLLKMMGKGAVDALPAPGSLATDRANVKLKYLEEDLERTLSDERSIFHPSNPEYIWSGGCPR
jgi:hypothetical protein